MRRNTMNYKNYPIHVQSSVEEMNRVFDTPEKRKFVANKARLHLSDKTKSDVYSEAYAYLLRSSDINTRIEDEYTQKLVAFFREAQKRYFNGSSMLDDFIKYNGKLPHHFGSYN